MTTLETIPERCVRHPSAAVWAVLDGKQLRLDCAECSAEVWTFQLEPSLIECSCGDPNCNKTESNPLYLHCRNLSHTGNKISVESSGQTQKAAVYCADCGKWLARFQLAGGSYLQ